MICPKCGGEMQKDPNGGSFSGLFREDHGEVEDFATEEWFCWKEIPICSNVQTFKEFTSNRVDIPEEPK